MQPTRSDPLESIEDGLIAMVRWANRPLSHQALRDAAGIELDRATYLVLARIAEYGPLRLSDLAAELGVDTSTMSRQVTRLVELEYVTRESDPSDRRAQLLRAQPAGEEIRRRFQIVRRDWLAQVLADWPDEDRAALARLLPRFAEDLRGTHVARPAG